MSKAEHDEFYDHKRMAHNGNYDNQCTSCRKLFDALVAASKRKVGIA